MTQNNRTHQGVTTRPQPGSTDTVLVYREGIFLGRVCGHTVHDCTGRLRSGDDFCRFMLSATEPAPVSVSMIATDGDPLDAAADEIAAELIAMAAESPDCLAFLDRIMERIAQARCIAVSPVREV